MGWFDPEWAAARKARAAERRQAERWLAANRDLQRSARQAELLEDGRRREAELASISEAMAASTDEQERRTLGREWNRVQERPGPDPREPVRTGPNRVFGGSSASGWGRHRQTDDAFDRAWARRNEKAARADAERRRAGKQRLFSTRPAGFYDGQGNRNVAYAPDNAGRKATRERFKDEIAARDAAMGKRARRERGRRLARQDAERLARRGGPRTVVTRLAGRDLLVETSNPKALERQLNAAAAKGQRVSLMPRFSGAVKGKRSDGVVGQEDADVRLYGRGYDAQKLLDKVHGEYGGDFGRFCEDQARRTGVMGALGLRSVSMNTWDPHETNPAEFEDEPIYDEEEYG